MAETEKEPVSRRQFLGMGVMGTFVGAVLTLPPAAFALSPAIKSVAQGQSDVPDEWKELGSVFEIPAKEPKLYRVKFPQQQTYDSGGIMGEQHIQNAVLISWHDGKVPALLENRQSQTLSQAEIEELTTKINVMSNACAHLGCPVRWVAEKEEIACPCHGGIYSINGAHLAGPPPHGLWFYTFEVRENGGIYVKHDFHVKEKSPSGDPNVVFPIDKPYVV